MAVYTPEPLPLSIDPVLAEYLHRELMRISNTFIGGTEEVGAIDYQPHDSDLDAISALTTQAYGRNFLTYASEAAFKASVNLETGVDFNAFSAVLAATTAAFTTAQQTKLSGIATGADVTRAPLDVIALIITDWNTALDNGWYMGNAAANAPSAAWYLGFVEAHGAAGYRTQTVHAFTTDSSSNTLVWRRDQQSGTWSSWYRLRWSEEEQNAVLGTALPTGDTIARRDGSGDITARLFRTEYFSLYTGAYILTQNAVGVGADNYARPMPLANLIALILPTYGAVGSYIVGYIYNVGIIENTNYAGSLIEPAGFSGSTVSIADDAQSAESMTKGGAALTGTWKSLGRSNCNPGSNFGRSTLFQRIA